jgi:peptide/nickel transport system substrate-binding protein
VTITRSASALMATVGLLLALAAPPASAETTLRVVITTDIRGLMPGISSDDSTGAVLQHVWEGLVAWRTDGTVAPMLAQDVAASSDGAVYTFTLRDGVRFHNGARLTSKEVVWTWRTLLEPKTAWPCRSNFDGSRQIKVESIEAPDERHVVFKLARPSGAFLSMMARGDCDAAGIAHPDSVSPEGAWVRAIGTGPFKVGDWRKGEFIELVKHDGYVSRSEPADGYAGGKRPMVDRVRFVIVPEPATAKTALLAGNLDLWPSTDPKYAKELGASPKIKVVSSPVAAINTLVMHTRDPVLKDPRIRQALNAAIDRAALSDAVTDGYAKPAASPIPVSSRYFGPVQRQGHAFDPAAAKKLLAAAGYRGQPIKITTNTRFATMHDIAIVVQAMARAAGISMDVEVVEFATQFDRYMKGDYQVMVWNYTPYLDPMFVFDRFTGDRAKQADKVWDDPKAIELLGKLAATAAPAARQPIFDDLHRLFIEDSPMVVWSSSTVVSAHSTSVKGYQPWPGRKPRLWNVEVAR